jgi:hypothetical protein
MSKEKVKRVPENICLEVGEEWHTIDYPDKKVESAEICHIVQPRGTYRMEGVDGYAFYNISSPIKVTELRINKDVVMTDEPINWIGMQRLAEHCKGNTLIAGLGLGLIIHHLKNNDKVTNIDVVEVNVDVIDLLLPLLPENNKVYIIPEDIRAYELSELAEYDTILFDVWVKGDKGMKIEFPSTGEIMTRAEALRALYPEKKVMVWGLHNDFNPAVNITPEVEKILKTLGK